MAEKEVVPNNSGHDAAAGHEKESLSPPQKQQKIEGNFQGSISEGSASKTLLNPDEEEDELLNTLALRSIMCEEDDALEDVASSLVEYYPSGFCDDPGDKWFKYLRRIVDSQVLFSVSGKNLEIILTNIFSPYFSCTCRICAVILPRGRVGFGIILFVHISLICHQGFDIEMDEVPQVERRGDIPFIPMVKLPPRLDYLGKLAIDRFNEKNVCIPLSPNTMYQMNDEFSLI